MWTKFRLSLPACLWNYKSNCYETNLSSVVVVHAKMVVKQVPNTNQPGVLLHITTQVLTFSAKNTIFKILKVKLMRFWLIRVKQVPNINQPGVLPHITTCAKNTIF